MERLHKISRHSSHKVSSTPLLEGKVLAINEDVPDPINSYQSLVALLNPSHIDLMLVGSPWCVECNRRNGHHAIVIYCEDPDTSPRRKPWYIIYRGYRIFSRVERVILARSPGNYLAYFPVQGFFPE